MWTPVNPSFFSCPTTDPFKLNAHSPNPKATSQVWHNYEEKFKYPLPNQDSGSLPDDIDLSDSTDGSDDDNFETNVPLIEDRNEQKADFGSGSGSLSGSGTSDGKTRH